jgi:hypothetical protein
MEEMIEGKLTARLKEVSPQFIVFELSIFDPTIAGELILPPAEFFEFLREQKVELVLETEDDRIKGMELLKFKP